MNLSQNLMGSLNYTGGISHSNDRQLRLFSKASDFSAANPWTESLLSLTQI